MSAERMPPEKQGWLGRLLGGLTGLVVRFPRATLAVGVGLAVASVAYAMWRLEYKASRVELLSPASDYNRRWLEYLGEFGDADDVVVVVEGSSTATVRPVLEELGARLAREERLFESLLYKIDTKRLAAKGLYLASDEQIAALERSLQAPSPILSGDWSALNFGGQLAAAGRRLEYAATANPVAAQAQLDRLRPLLDHLRRALMEESPPPTAAGPLAGALAADALPAEYLTAHDGRLGLLLLRLVVHEEGFVRGSEGIDRLRAIVAEMQPRHPEARIGLTGLPIMENDEMRVSQRDMSLANILSFVGVAAVFVAILGGWRHPLCASLTLLIGTAWAFGYLTLVIGHLNILSVSFSVFLIGLGMDFSIHYISRYLQLRLGRESLSDALQNTAVGVGPGITTGAVTTAVAFLAAGATDFPGVAELGIIAGGGILLCFVATVTVLPAMLVLSDRKRPRMFTAAPLDVGHWTERMLRRPQAVLAFSVVATAFIAIGAPRVWYDHNLLNLQSQGLESVDLERKLLAESDQNTWYAISVADDERELLARKDRFLQLASVDRVEEIASLVGVERPERTRQIASMQARLKQLPADVPLVPVEQPAQLAKSVTALYQAAAQSPASARLARELMEVRDLLFATRPEDYFLRMTRYQQSIAADGLQRFAQLREAAAASPPAFSDLPDSLVRRFRSPNGKHLLKVYGRGDIWDRAALEAFVQDLRGVDAEVTGEPLQAFEASREMKESYQRAMVYAFLASCAILAIDFRRLSDVLLALLPLAVGMLQMFGLMGWLGVPLNPANMIVLPLIFGIGVDEGVHIIHDYRSQAGAYRMSNSTAVSVLLSSLQEIVGFGSLMISEHQGLQSLGRVLTLGMTTSMFTSLVMLPALLTWMGRRRQQRLESREPVASSSGRAPRPARRPARTRVA